MDVEFLKENMDLLPSTSTSISLETELIIRNSLVILQSENKFENIFFWGKIDGLIQDYLISFGYTFDSLSQRRFFYSLDGIRWRLLSLPSSKHLEALNEWNGRFTGDPHKFFVMNLNGKPIGIKEEDLLAYIVNLITEESALMPRGALYMRVDGTVMRNPYFGGLKESSLLLSNYYFYRQPRNRNNNIQRKDHNEPLDFLDPIEQSVEKTFCLSTSPINSNVILIRSLLWEGMCSFYEMKSRKFGFIYFGNGFKNNKLSLML